VFNTKQFGAYISAKRKDIGLTQAELAEKVNLTRQSISKYETGECFPDISILIQLADIFGVTIDELVKSGIPP